MSTFLQTRPVLGILSFGLLSSAVSPPHVFYSSGGFACVTLAVGLALAACGLREDRRWAVSPRWGRVLLAVVLLGILAYAGNLVLDGSRKWLLLWAGLAPLGASLVRRREPWPFFPSLLVALALILNVYGLSNVVFTCSDYRAAQAVARWAAAALLGLNALWMLELGGPTGDGPAFRTRLALVFVAGAILRISTVVASPEPLIDVYEWLRQAPQYLAQGINPYSATYTNPYASERCLRCIPQLYAANQPSHVRYPAYPPLPILMALPFRVGGLDVRYANIVCDLAAALVLYLAGRQRGQRLLGAVAAAIHLSLPGSSFLAEFAWYEPMLAAALGGGLLLAERGQRLGLVLLGLGLTGKQFGIAMLLPLWRARGNALLVATVVVAAVLCLPFLLWDPGAFLDVVLFMHLKRPPHLSLTLQSGLSELLGVHLPAIATWLLAGVGITWLAWRSPRRPLAAAFWTGTAMLVFIYCHPQGFFNYYYLAKYLMLLGAVALAADAADHPLDFADVPAIFPVQHQSRTPQLALEDLAGPRA